MNHITEDKGCYRVKLQRRGIVYRVTISFGRDKAAALARAIAERDHALALLGPVTPCSNTGEWGICEMMKWCFGRPRQCFTATVGGTKLRRMRRFYYRDLATRDRALASAIVWRQQLTRSGGLASAAI